MDLDAFFVSVEQVLAPALRGKPVIVGGQPDRRGVVASASYEARVFGIRSAMPLAKAYRLCPQAVFLQGNFSRYREVSARFMDILADFSPCLEPAGLDEAYLDITGCDFYGSPYQTASLLKERVKKELDIIASVGISGCKVVSKIASDLGKPDGLIEVAAGQEKDFLAPLPVAKLPGVGVKTEQVLKSMGITTIGQLAALSPELVKGRLGAFGTALHRYAHGIDNRKVELHDEAKSISRETTFVQDIRDHNVLRSILRYLCERVGAELRRQSKQARCVSVKLRYADFVTITRSHRVEEATSVDNDIFANAVWLLDRVLVGKQKLVRLLGVEVSSLVSDDKQLHLFDSGVQRQQRLDKAIDRIRKKYGFNSIQSGRTLALKEIFESNNSGQKRETTPLS